MYNNKKNIGTNIKQRDNKPPVIKSIKTWASKPAMPQVELRQKPEVWFCLEIVRHTGGSFARISITMKWVQAGPICLMLGKWKSAALIIILLLFSLHSMIRGGHFFNCQRNFINWWRVPSLFYSCSSSCLFRSLFWQKNTLKCITEKQFKNRSLGR